MKNEDVENKLADWFEENAGDLIISFGMLWLIAWLWALLH